jgi:cytochrome oxidase Cu insertion factor (SCO1/SenC/PrrC family)
MTRASGAPRRYWLGRRNVVATLLVLAMVLATGPTTASDRKLASPPDFPISFGGSFTLTDHEGRPRTDRDFEGRYLLVFFGYTFCPDICPTGLQNMATALDLLGEAGRWVQPLFISVDPERDRLKTLKAFVAHFHPRLIGLTGTEEQVRAVARAYRIHRRKVILPDTPKEEYLVDHSSIIYLMGPDGGFVTLFPHGTTPEFMAAALHRYLS